MDWMVGVNQLDAAQKRTINAILKDLSRNHWIKGFAGTGKTIVLTHILKRLAAEEDQRSCFATYTHALKDMVETGLTQSERDIVQRTTLTSVRKLPGRFDVLVADEFQDVQKQQLDAIREKSSILVFAADPAQRIYRLSIKEAKFKEFVEPVKEHHLQTIHRINLPVYTVATTIFPDSRFSPGSIPDDDREPVLLMSFSKRMQESTSVLKQATQVARNRAPSAILVPGNTDMERFLEDIGKSHGWSGMPTKRDSENPRDPFGAINAYLRKKKSPLQLFGSKSGSLPDSDKKKVVYLMTYYNSKGLEFPSVFLPYLGSTTKLNPVGNANTSEEAQLFFVACTRAKERLYLSYSGKPHRFVTRLGSLGDDVLALHDPGKMDY